MRSISSGVSLLETSSRIRTRGSRESTRASSTMCCCGRGEPAHRDLDVQGEGEPGEQLLRLFPHAAMVQAQHARLEKPAGKDVLRGAQGGDDVEMLVDDADSAADCGARGEGFHPAAVEDDFSAVLAHRAAQELHQGRFAGPMRAHQGMDLPPVQVEIRSLQRRDAPVGDADSAHLEDGIWLMDQPRRFHSIPSFFMRL